LQITQDQLNYLSNYYTNLTVSIDEFNNYLSNLTPYISTISVSYFDSSSETEGYYNINSSSDNLTTIYYSVNVNNEIEINPYIYNELGIINTSISNIKNYVNNNTEDFFTSIENTLAIKQTVEYFING
jgi:hypothetical protein